MKNKAYIIFLFILFLLTPGMGHVFALNHAQRDGIFTMDVPAHWHWVDSPEEIIITYPDGKTVAIDIQLMPSRKLSPADIKKSLKEGNERIIKDGIEAHHGVLIDDKETSLDGVYAKRLDFKTSPPNPIYATYISLFNKGYAFTVTYGSEDPKIHSVMDDAVATIKFR